MFLIGIVLFAFAIRILSWPGVFTSSGVMFLESDAIYHMRRVTLAVHHHLHLDPLDTYLNYPQGFHCNWPNLFDQFMAIIALALGQGHPSQHLIDTVGAFVPPVLGALTCVPVYFVARAFLEKGYALSAAGIFSIMPFHIQLSVLGRPDHHVAVVFIASLVLWCAVYLQKTESIAATIRTSLLLGVLLYVSLLIWVGSVVFALILMAQGAVVILLAVPDADRHFRVVLAAAIPQLVAASLIAPIALHTYWATEGIQAWEALSAFHVEAMALGGIVLILLGVVSRWFYAKRRQPQQLVGGTCALLAGTLVVGVVLLHSSLGQLMIEASHWVGKVDPLFRYCVESTPLSTAAARENFTSIVFLFPALLIWVLARARTPARRAQAVLLILWTLAFGLAAIKQERFSDVLSLFAAILDAVFIAIWVGFIQTLIMILTLRTKPRHIALGTCVAIAVIANLFAPTLTWLKGYVHSAPRYSLTEDYELGRWLDSHTEQTSGYLDPKTTPEYGVLASWEFGHVITCIAHRPNIANNFIGWHENHDANLAPYRFFIEQDPATAMAILDQYHVRYIIVHEPLQSGELPRIVDVLGLDPKQFFTRQPSTAPGLAPVYGPTMAACNTLAMRLYASNAKDLPQFALVYETSEKVNVGGTPMGDLKVFRYTPSANHVL